MQRFLICTFLLQNILTHAQKQVKEDSLYFFLEKSYKGYEESNYLESLVWGRKLLEKAYRLKDSSYVAEAYYVLGLVDETIQDYDKAEDKYYNALKIVSKVSKKRDSVFLMDIYNGLANVYSFKKKYHKADSLYHKALEIGELLNNEAQKDIILNISWNYLSENSCQKVNLFLPELLSYQIKDDNRTLSLDDTIFFSDLNFVLGWYYGKIKEYNLAYDKLDFAIKLAKSKNLYQELSQVLEIRAKFLKAQGKFEEALFFNEKYIESHKKQIDQNLLKKLQAEKVKYEVSEYERALRLLKKQKQLSASIAESNHKLSWLYLILSIILGVSLIIIYLVNYKRKKLIRKLNHKNKLLIDAQKKAKLATQIKSNFISNISHELRTPLHGVIGITSLLLAEKKLSASNQKLLESLKFSGDYLLGLISNVLLMSKIDNGKVKVKQKLVMIESLLSTIRSGIMFSAEEKDVQIKFCVDEEIPKKVYLDANIVSEVLINLIENAIKFSKGGNVTTYIKINKDANCTDKEVTIRFCVEDNGTGIPKDKQEIIFQKFSQIASERNMLEGTGIGLSLVKSLLLQLGTDIKLESEIGKGSKFYFDLPCKLFSDKDSNVSISKEKLKVFESNLNILLVEDNKINMMVIQKYLASYKKINLEIISDGKEAYKAILNQDYDLVLLDINIPSMNGFAITKKIRKKGFKLPIIAVTASELTEIQDKAYAVGINDIIIKPFQKKKLIAVISKYLQ
ncbi:tetratricopeptide repeat-containing hybrid sensor histidine kinase/response regulator [Mesonia aestuariivivens]|uniref:histidine kinase n=1 Tax=Mesonia aestuariivivens TaxID=2796128 RepID=A0ABS6VYN4_9FLAO|nr:response regulator [Mesonia aestuariivivens]MBW2960695.1 response regulator [Mesonia aestuariivivens]